MPLDDAQLWILALSGILNEINGDRNDLLGGAERPTRSSRAMQMLATGWQVYTPADAIAALEWIARTGDRDACAAPRAGSAESLAGWDYGRMATVAGWSYVAYLLDRDTAWAWMKRAALAVQPAFGSFAEFGQSYLRGFAASTEEPDGDIVKRARVALATLCCREGSPFLLPWRLDLDATPAPDHAVREVHVAPGDSIAAAIKGAGAGGRVVLAPGVYRESVRPEHGVEIVADAAGEVTLENIESPALYVGPNVGVYARGIALRAGRTTRGDTLNALRVVSGFAHLESCTLQATHHGAAIREEGQLHLFDCRTLDCGRSGVVADVGNPVILGSEILGSGGHGVACLGGRLGAVIEGSHIADSAEHGIVAQGRARIRDTHIEVSGGVGIMALGAVSVERSRVGASKTWGIVVDRNAVVRMHESTVEGSTIANVDVVSGHVVISKSVISRSAGEGLVVQKAGGAYVVDCTFDDNGKWNIFMAEGARHVFERCTVRAGGFGIGARGSSGYFANCMIEGTAKVGVEVFGTGGVAFVDCKVRGCGGTGMVIGVNTVARLSRCSVVGSRGAGFVVAADARAHFDRCTSEDNGEPDALNGALLSPARDHTASAVAFSPVVEDGGSFATSFAVTPAWLDRGEDRPVPVSGHSLGRAMMCAMVEATDGLMDITVKFDGTHIELRAKDRDTVEAACEAVATMACHPGWLALAVDRVQIEDLAEDLDKEAGWQVGRWGREGLS